MDFLATLSVIFVVGSLVILFSMLSIGANMAIVAVYYSFIKRLCRSSELSKTFRKLKNDATQRFSGYKKAIEENGPSFDVKAYLSSFEESLFLSQKDYKRIFIFSLVTFVLIFVPFLISVGMAGEKMAQGMDIKQFIASDPFLFAVSSFFYLIVFLSIALVAFSLPVILIFYGILNLRVEKKMERLENFA
ncbi:hypothetical protein [Bartonella machadoae]|uniref:hypothetical protein n=1 Tax=Bartonella machadoae TaxID=2893471 RepID=UPI001F4C5D95|nr:hypothetical protein [Bartonella machadoae]UNE53941.1 hypothetical protein LNM86_10210 [Bartonella machadoae]